jgi:FlaA1/EpsC-like NDP-sugar epimerase
MKRVIERLLKLLDDWPLLVNVLLGHLSFIGPKPEKPEFLRYYSDSDKQIFRVRPGIWGPYNLLRLNEFTDGIPSGMNYHEYYRNFVLADKLRLELKYVESKRFGKDLRFIFDLLKLRVLIYIREQIQSGASSRNFLMPIDLLLVTVSYFLAFQLRFDWSVPREEYRLFLLVLPVVLSVRVAVFYLLHVYKNLWKYIGIKDLMTIVTACSISSVMIITVIFLMGVTTHSRSIFFIDWMLSVLLIGGFRVSLRVVNEKLTMTDALRKNVLIIGAGDVGEMLLRELQKKFMNQYHVVGFLDDDETKQGRTIHGVKVLGKCENILGLAPPLRVDEALITIAKLSSDEIKSIVKYCKDANVRHRLVPAVSDLLSGTLHLSKFRQVEVSDLFGREPVELDLSAIQTFLHGKRVLVTGAGGSIGSELCRQIAEYNPECLILVDKNENYLHEIRCEINTQFEGVTTFCSLSDITHKAKQTRLFQKYRPQVVFHAAAQKHVPLSEENPAEAIINNVGGTKIIADLADEFGVHDFVMVSTDKAVNPTSVMGTTKRVAELYIQALARQSKTNFVTVRFGNVLNSNGSVIPIFMKQIERGGPITITHPDVERYFMSIAEAVQLILQAVTMGQSGQIFVLEMGKSIKIVDIAKELIKQAGLRPFEDILIKFVGLRPGEKMYEELMTRHEEPVPTPHASIKTLKSRHVLSMMDIKALIEAMTQSVEQLATSQLTAKLKEIVPEYTPSPPNETNGKIKVDGASSAVNANLTNIEAIAQS